MIISNNRNGFICEEGPRSIRMGKYNRPLYHILNKIGLYKECKINIKFISCTQYSVTI